MATLGLLKSDLAAHRGPKRNRNRREGCGCLSITAQNNLSLLGEVYDPNVNYSLKKRGRWKLLDVVDRNPAEIFDEGEGLDRIQVSVVSRQIYELDCTPNLNPSRHFYSRTPEGTIELKDSPRKRRRSMNTRSMMGSSLRQYREPLESSAEVYFTSTQVEENMKALRSANIWRKREICQVKRRLKLNKLVKYLAEEDYAEDAYEKYESEEEVMEESAWSEEVTGAGDDESVLSHDFEIVNEIDDLSDFEVLEKPAVFEFDDKVKIHSRCLYLPKISLSENHLRSVYGADFIAGRESSKICAINIGDMIGSRIFSRNSLKKRCVQGYVVLEQIEEYLNVRLSCYVTPDLVPEIYPPILTGIYSVEDIVEECIIHCLDNYKQALVVEDRKYLTLISGYSTPFTEVQYETVEMKFPSNHVDMGFIDHQQIQNSHRDRKPQCGICLEYLAPGESIALAECSHSFCEACSTHYLLSQIKAGQHILRCPEVGCQCNVDHISKLRLLSANMLQIHHQRLLSAMLECHENVIWCPNPACSRPLLFIDLSVHRSPISQVMKTEALNTFRFPLTQARLPVNVSCLCKAKFCLHCRQEAHWPASCQTHNAFVATLQSNGEWKPKWSVTDHLPLRIYTKPCPKCHNQWEKDGGCNLVTCGYCRASYCWRCGKVRKDHDYHFPCDSQKYADNVLQATEHVIFPVFSSQHLRMMAEATTVSALKPRFFRLVRRALVLHSETVTDSDMEASITAIFNSLSECAHASQFSKVAAMAEKNEQLREILDTSSKTFEDLTISALRALNSLGASEIPKSQKEAICRLRDCQVKGHIAAQKLNVTLSTCN